jgi:potassium efflux system protein
MGAAPVAAQTSAESQLIREVDRIINGRQAEALLELGPSPLNPVHWLPALRELRTYGAQLHTEISMALDNPTQMEEARSKGPLIVVLLVVGLVLVVRGRSWSRRAMTRVLGEDPNALRWLMGFVISTGSLLLPLLGIVALVRAVYATQLVGLRLDQFLNDFVTATAIYLVARWIAMRIFPAKEARNLPLNLTEAQRRSGRWYGAMIGLLGAGEYLLRDIAAFSNWSAEVQNVILFPLLLVMSLMVLRIAGLLRAHVVNSAEESGEESVRKSYNRVISLALFGIGGIAPVLAAIGYFRLAEYLLFPSLITLGILFMLLILQRLVIEIYVLISGNREGVSDSLIPVTIGFLLFIAALPLFALAWGVRVTTLTEIWTSLFGA